MQPWYRRYPSLVIAVVFIALVVGWYGYRWLEDIRIARQPLEAIPPSRVTFLALKRGSGYRIVMKNGQPSVIEMSDQESKFGDPESSTADKVRIPQDKLLKSLTGDPDALGALLVALRDVRPNDETEYTDVIVEVPVTYQVLSRTTTVRARMKVSVEADASFLKDPDQLTTWKRHLSGQPFVAKAASLLNNCEVVLTEKHLTEAWYTETEIAFEQQKRYALHFRMTEAGRRRLLQETSKHIGEQLIIYADNSPVANPVVRQRLNVRQADIPNITNEDLVLMLMDTLRQVGVKVSAPSRSAAAN